jgi:Fungalysin metallopeptidase (M36)
MPSKQIVCSDFFQEKELVESSGKFRVTGMTPVRGEPALCELHFEPKPDARPRPVHLLKTRRARGRMEMSRSRKIARRIFELETPPSQDPPRDIAERLLRTLAPQLGLSRDLADLRFEKVRQTVFGPQVLFQQYVGTTQVSGAWVRVDIDNLGRVFNIQNDVVPAAVIAARARGSTRSSRLAGDEGQPLSGADAVAAARAAVETGKGGRKRLIGEPELLYRPTDGDPLLAWKVVVRTGPPTKEWKIYVDAFSGLVLSKRNQLKKARPAARVFDPNPVVALNTVELKDSQRKLPAAAYREVELQGLTGSGYLDGEYVSTSLTRRRVRRPDGDFRFERKKRGFTEAMVYFHIDRVQRHLQALGFDNILAKGIKVNVAGQREDNSYYSPAEKYLSFGTGGVDDAEDAETILHEYGHAIQDCQVSGFGDSDECAAMGEGFGDFLAASYFADWKPAWLRPAISSWDCIAYAGDPPCLRRLDSNKKYPKDITGEVHDDGEIWSACLWELRHQLGRATTEKLVIAHHYLLNRWASFEDAANALLTADGQLCGGRNRKLIHGVFVQRGIFPDPRRGGKRAGARLVP